MSVEMKLELGHRAALRVHPTPEGFTHDWMVFVKGAEGSDIQHFVDKVVFYLHESFPKPKRVVKEPPYQVAESGYAGFMMPIEVYFRNKEEPKKVRFEYDLFLKIEPHPVYNIRREKLTFQNPSDDFRRKLLKARGVGSGTAVSGGTPSLQTQTTAPIQHVEEPQRPLTTHTKPTPSIAEKKPKSHSAIKEPVKTPPPPPPPPPAPVAKASQQFTDIFGLAIKTKPSPDLSSKNKEISHSSHPKQNKALQPPSGPVGNVASKEPKSASKVGHSPEGKETKSKPNKSEKEPKSSSLKRPPPPDGQSHSGIVEKKKKYHSNSDTGEKHTDSCKTKDSKEKKEKHRSKGSGHTGKKDKHKTSSHHTSNKDHISKSPKAVNNVKSLSPDKLLNDDSNDVKSSIKQEEEEDANSPADYLVDATSTWCEISPGDMDDPVGRELISPLSPDIKHSPAQVSEKLRRSSNHDTEDSMDEKSIKPIKVEKSPKPKNISKTRKVASQVNNNNNNNNSSSSSVHRSSKQNGSMKENHLSPTESKGAKVGKVALDPAYIKELIDLQKKIMSLEDHSLLQRVVEVIEETGRFQMTNKSFDFDLCSLDQSTVRKLKHCLAS